MFDKIEETTRAYNKAVRIYHGSKDNINFPISNEDNLENPRKNE